MKGFLVAGLSTLLGLRGVQALVQQWGQCGGINYTGDTSCVSGTTCYKVNDWYYQCLAASTMTSSISTAPSSSSSSSKPSSSSSSRSSSSTSKSSSSTSASASATVSPLNDLAVAAGKQYWGFMVDTTELANATYKAAVDITHLFGQITPGNKMKWDATEPSRGTFSYSAADAIVTWALAGGKQIRGHTLVWHSQLPSWVSSGNFNNATLVSIMQNHITNLVTHFSGKVKTWDLCNEIMNDDGTWRTSVFYKTIGEYFVDIALRTAAAADPNVGIALNDYNLDSVGAKVQAYVNLVIRLKSRGVKVTQIGSQAHLIVGSTPSASVFKTIFTSLIATGVDVAVTELDIRMTLPVTDARLAQQKKDFNSIILACVQTPRCIGVTLASWTDSYSWVPSTFSGQGAASPLDERSKPKPAYYGIIDALNDIAD